MDDYQIAMAVPVSDTAHRPKDGEVVTVLLPAGIPARAMYIVGNSPLMFDVQPHETWMNAIDEETLSPTHWLRVLPDDMPFIKWPEDSPLSEDQRDRIAAQLAKPTGRFFFEDDTTMSALAWVAKPPAPDFRELVRRRFSEERRRYMKRTDNDRISRGGLANLRLIQALSAVLQNL